MSNSNIFLIQITSFYPALHFPVQLNFFACQGTKVLKSLKGITSISDSEFWGPARDAVEDWGEFVELDLPSFSEAATCKKQSCAGLDAEEEPCFTLKGTLKKAFPPSGLSHVNITKADSVLEYFTLTISYPFSFKVGGTQSVQTAQSKLPVFEMSKVLHQSCILSHLAQANAFFSHEPTFAGRGHPMASWCWACHCLMT